MQAITGVNPSHRVMIAIEVIGILRPVMVEQSFVLVML